MASITAEERKALKGRGFLPTKDGNFSARLITVNGCLTAEQVDAISQAAKRFGNGRMFFTTRLTAEIPGISYENIELFTSFISKVGLETGGTGSRVRPVVCCKGSVCLHGITDTLRLAEEIHNLFYKGWYDVKLPHKFKVGIGGCPNGCVKPELHEFGIVAQRVPDFDEEMCNGCKKCAPMQTCPVAALKRENGRTVLYRDVCNNCGKCIEKCPFDCITQNACGYQLYVGGKWGKFPRNGSRIPGVYSQADVLKILEKTLLIYREQGKTGERLGVTIDRLGEEYFISEILSDEVLLRKKEILEAPLHLTGGATC